MSANDDDLKLAVSQAKSELEQIRKFKDRVQINPADLKKIHPNLMHYDEANKLVEVPIPDPLAKIDAEEIGVIAQLSILERCMTVEIPVDNLGQYSEEYRVPEGIAVTLDKSMRQEGNRLYKKIGGLPGTMAGIDRFINLTPAIDGERAELFASAIKPQLPNRPEMPEAPQEPGFFEKIREGIARLTSGGSSS